MKNYCVELWLCGIVAQKVWFYTWVDAYEYAYYKQGIWCGEYLTILTPSNPRAMKLECVR